MNNYKKLKELALFLLCIILFIVIVKYLGVIEFIGSLFKVLLPLFVGFIYAWLINPLIDKLSKKHNRNLICLLFFLLVLFIIGLFIYLLIPTLYKEIQEIVVIIPEVSDSVILRIQKYGLEKGFIDFSQNLVNNAPLYIYYFFN